VTTPLVAPQTVLSSIEIVLNDILQRKANKMSQHVLVLGKFRDAQLFLTQSSKSALSSDCTHCA
jgi:hypothetical protein